MKEVRKSTPNLMNFATQGEEIVHVNLNSKGKPEIIKSFTPIFHCQQRERLKLFSFNYIKITTTVQSERHSITSFYFLMGFRKSKGSAEGFGDGPPLPGMPDRGAPPGGGFVWMYP